MKRRLTIAAFPLLAVVAMLICAAWVGELVRASAQNQNQSQPNRNAQGSPKRPGGASVNNNAAGINRPIFRVTAAALTADNPNPTGTCPLNVTFHGSITANGVGTVTYVFEGSDGSRSPVQTLVFSAAGTQRVSTTWTPRGALSSPYLGSEAIRILSPNELRSSSKLGSFTITCENQQAQGGQQSGLFRVVLNGFTVNNESDDDILEGDGRGDEIFITSDALVVNRDGTDSPMPRVQTKVMGDPNGHPERVPAGSKPPSPSDVDQTNVGGLQTGDVFPTRPPWRPVRDIRTDRPPIVLWQGTLTFGQNMVMIAPIIWEWDSDDLSASQNSVNRALPRWFEDSKANLLRYIGIVFPPDPLIHFAYPIRLDGKAGTRPIGYKEAGIRSELPTADTSHDYLEINGLFLTYDSAVKAVDKVNLGVRGLNEIHYKDGSDHGEYTLYLLVERLR